MRLDAFYALVRANEQQDFLVRKGLGASVYLGIADLEDIGQVGSP